MEKKRERGQVEGLREKGGGVQKRIDWIRMLLL